MGRDTALEAAVAAIMPFMLFPIELISELMKNVSLPLRLFGNIHGGHVAVETLNTQYGPMMHFPVGGLLILVKLLTVIVQALVFTMLTCVYISLVTHHEEEHGGGHEPAHAH
jgi:F-type H+-transporting ATPase subunit a